MANELAAHQRNMRGNKVKAPIRSITKTWHRLPQSSVFPRSRTSAPLVLEGPTTQGGGTYFISLVPRISAEDYSIDVPFIPRFLFHCGPTAECPMENQPERKNASIAAISDPKERYSSMWLSSQFPITDRQPTHTPPTSELAAPVGGHPKRLLDILVSVTALILLAPLLAIVAMVMLVTLRRPIVFAQQRVGHDGRPFRCYKFRTMVRDADAVLAAHLASHPEAADEWWRNQKLAHDPRVTFLGRLLRKSSIDELPQLYNVLRGDMSCVGPRPIIADELQRYGNYREDYLRAKPGMTGLWQVSGRNALSYEDRVALDSRYVRNWTFVGDLQILAKTIPAVIRFGETA